MILCRSPFFFFFFFNDTATTEIYTLSLHDALPICEVAGCVRGHPLGQGGFGQGGRSEEHTSELQSPCNLVCRLLLEKKKKKTKQTAVVNTTHQSSGCAKAYVLTPCLRRVLCCTSTL